MVWNSVLVHAKMKPYTYYVRRVIRINKTHRDIQGYQGTRGETSLQRRRCRYRYRCAEVPSLKV